MSAELTNKQLIYTETTSCNNKTVLQTTLKHGPTSGNLRSCTTLKSAIFSWPNMQQELRSHLLTYSIGRAIRVEPASIRKSSQSLAGMRGLQVAILHSTLSMSADAVLTYATQLSSAFKNDQSLQSLVPPPPHSPSLRIPAVRLSVCLPFPAGCVPGAAAAAEAESAAEARIMAVISETI